MLGLDKTDNLDETNSSPFLTVSSIATNRGQFSDALRRHLHDKRGIP